MSRPRTIVCLPSYMREKNAKRRAAAKLLGICIECASSKAAPARTKCADCLTVNRIAQQNRRAA